MSRLAFAVLPAGPKRRVRTTLSAISLGAALSLVAMSFAGAASARTVTSQAWAGYQANHQTFRHVAARWAVPALTCPGTTAAGDPDSYFWAGLGPGTSSSERVGVRELCTGTIPTYIAYLEMNGEYEAQGIDPTPGDQISASVSFTSGKYRFSLADSTQSKSFSLRYACGAFSFGHGACGRATAEVIAGMTAPGLAPLAEYGTATFDGIAITDARGHRGSFAKNRHWRINRLIEHHGTSVAATPSPLSRRGKRFTDTWRHS
jgi:hypothetical protein